MFFDYHNDGGMDMLGDLRLRPGLRNQGQQNRTMSVARESTDRVRIRLRTRHVEIASKFI